MQVKGTEELGGGCLTHFQVDQIFEVRGVGSGAYKPNMPLEHWRIGPSKCATSKAGLTLIKD